jgi:Na+-translocating ferredoxin:NAD+ oxidoreductase RnfD subunit
MNPPAPPPPKGRDPRTGLRTSATLATVFTILGHNFFGFEQSALTVLVALATGYSCAIAFEWIDAKANGRQPGFLGKGWLGVVDFLLSAHMTSITMSFLIFTQDHVWVLAFAVATALASKYLFRVRINGRLQHVFNPSNFGVAVTLVLFQYVASIPWGYTEELGGWWDVLVPLFIVGLGFRLNLLFTKRLPLIGSWLGFFLLQGAIRSVVHGLPFTAQLFPLTGIAFVLFTFYMITDPQTSPTIPRNQVIYGAGIALSYAVLLELHVMFTMFFAVVMASAGRAAVLLAYNALESRRAPGPALALGQT